MRLISEGRVRVVAKLMVDDKEIVLSDRDYSNRPLSWPIIEQAKVDAMIVLNKMMYEDKQVSYS